MPPCHRPCQNVETLKQQLLKRERPLLFLPLSSFRSPMFCISPTVIHILESICQQSCHQLFTELLKPQYSEAIFEIASLPITSVTKRQSFMIPFSITATQIQPKLQQRKTKHTKDTRLTPHRSPSMTQNIKENSLSDLVDSRRALLHRLHPQPLCHCHGQVNSHFWCLWRLP